MKNYVHKGQASNKITLVTKIHSEKIKGKQQCLSKLTNLLPIVQ